MPRLRRSDCSSPGLGRRRAGRGFVYIDPAGRRVSDAATLERIRSLAIPPAWEQVWICPWPNGHIQAIGSDAKGRRQYRYHDAWRVSRDREKFDHMIEVGMAMPAVRRRCAEDLALPGMPRERVLAGAVRLLDLGCFRVGGEEYAAENGSFGLATLLKSHVRVAGEEMTFSYPAKSGQQRTMTVVDPEAAAIMKALKRRRSGGPELLAFQRGRRWVDVRSEQINDYLCEVAGLPISAKDFRTWNATVLAAVALARSEQPASTSARKRVVNGVIREVADVLGNTPTVCRASYIDPMVVDRYLEGETIRSALRGDDGDEGLAAGPNRTRDRIEAAVISLLCPDHAAEAA